MLQEYKNDPLFFGIGCEVQLAQAFSNETYFFAYSRHVDDLWSKLYSRLSQFIGR